MHNKNKQANPALWLPDTPAYASFVPSKPSWQTIWCYPETLPKNQVWVTLIEQYPDIVRVEKMLSQHQEPYGFFRFSGKNTDWFVKLVNLAQAKRQHQANDIASYLAAESSLQTSLLITDASIQLAKNCHALVTEFKTGTLVTISSIPLVAKSIANLHQALATIPQKTNIKQAAFARESMLLATWKNIDNCKVPANVLTMLQAHSPKNFTCLTHNAQVIHGDLNLGNMLLLSNNKLLFLDFEDTQTAWFSPLVELAFVLERLLLLPLTEGKISKQTFIEQGRLLLQSYSKEQELTIIDASQLVNILQSLAIRSLLLLTKLSAQKNSKVTELEWQKFVFLYNLAKDYSPELIAIVDIN